MTVKRQSVEQLFQQIGDPTEPRSVHNKIYLEQSVTDAIKDYQIKEGHSSFSEAGRALLLIGLFASGDVRK